MNERERIVNEMHKVQAMTEQQFAEAYVGYEPYEKDDYLRDLQNDLDEIDLEEQDDYEDEDEEYDIWNDHGFASEEDYWRFVL